MKSDVLCYTVKLQSVHVNMVVLAFLLTAVLKRSIFRYVQQTSCITRDLSRVSHENFLQLMRKFLLDPCEFNAKSMSLEALLPGKNEKFTQDT